MMKIIDDIQCAKCRIVLLSSLNRPAFHDIILGVNGVMKDCLSRDGIPYEFAKSWTTHYMYIVKDEKPKIGDWCMIAFAGHNGLMPFNILSDADMKTYDEGNHDDITVVASTDPLLTKLPVPAHRFIRKYIDNFNEGTPNSSVFVEYEPVMQFTHGTEAYGTGTMRGPQSRLPDVWKPKLYAGKTVNVMFAEYDWNAVWDKFHAEYKDKSTNVALNFFEWLRDTHDVPKIKK